MRGVTPGLSLWIHERVNRKIGPVGTKVCLPNALAAFIALIRRGYDQRRPYPRAILLHLLDRGNAIAPATCRRWISNNSNHNTAYSEDSSKDSIQNVTDSRRDRRCHGRCWNKLANPRQTASILRLGF